MVTVKQLTSAVVEIKTDDGQEITVANGMALDYLEVLAEQAPGQVRVYLSANGFNIDESIRQMAAELAGLSGYDLTKQSRKGYIEF
jgi:hypothetical protein